MASRTSAAIEPIQALAARLLATHPAGRGLRLVGGFRYGLLNGSARASLDLDYHWEGDLLSKQTEIVEFFRARLLPEVKRRFGYDGDVRAATGPNAESPAVRTVELSFHRSTEVGSRIEIPVDLRRIACLDPPVVRTQEGTVFLTVSDADMIESKVLACVSRTFPQVRDVVDVFLFQDALRPDSPARLAQKLNKLGLPPADALQKLGKLAAQRGVHIRNIERLLDEQFMPTVAANLRAAGGGAMIWDATIALVDNLFARAAGSRS